MVSEAKNFAADANIAANDECIYVYHGCMAPMASNFDSLATSDDGSCIVSSPPPSPPPPTSPPPPSPPPPSPPLAPPAFFAISMEMVIAATVSDFTDSVLTAMRHKVAALTLTLTLT